MTPNQLYNDFSILPFISFNYTLKKEDKEYLLSIHFNIVKKIINDCSYTYQILQRQEVLTEKKRKISIEKLGCKCLKTLRIDFNDEIEQALLQTTNKLEREILIKSLYFDFLYQDVFAELTSAGIEVIEIEN